MIIINGEKAKIDVLLSKYPNGSVQKIVLKTLWDSQTEYKYETQKQLEFELALRKEIVEAAYKLYKSNMEFEVFRDTYCNPQYWRRQGDGGFLLRQDVNPSNAINDIFINTNMYATECATAMVIVYYKALLSVYPEKLFNKLFDKIYLMNWHYIDKLLKEIGYMEYADDYLPGDRRYVKNPDVDPTTPEWQGENLIDMSNGLYYGHGIGIKNVNGIIKELNENRRPWARQSASLLDSAGRPDFKNLADIYNDYIEQEH